jgi:hypothetical protein
MDYAAMSVGNAAAEDAAGSPLPRTVAGLIEKLAAAGSARGYVTYDELSAALSLDQLSSEEIEDAITMLSELGIRASCAAFSMFECTVSPPVCLPNIKGVPMAYKPN